MTAPSDERNTNHDSSDGPIKLDRAGQASRTVEEENGDPKGRAAGFKVFDRRFWAREESEDEADQEPHLSGSKPTYVEELEHRTQEAESRLAEYIQAYREKVEVEFERVKERLEREAQKQVDIQLGRLLLELLEVLDNLELSVKSARESRDLEALVQGIVLIRDQFVGKLGNLGLKQEAAEGQPFDPARHEAVAVEQTDDAELDGRITEVFKSGFLFRDRLLRPAMVKVAKKP